MRTKLVVNENGIGLIETIAALGIAIIVITSLVSLSVFTLKASVQSKLLLKSSKLASEEMEYVRAYRDSTTWAVFLSSVGSCVSTACHMLPTLAVSPGEEVFDAGKPMEIKRKFTVSDPIDGTFSGNETLVRVSITVSWKVGGQTKLVHSYTDLSNWESI